MGFIKSIFKRPKAPVVQQTEPTPAPTIDQASQNAEDDLRMRRRKGRNAYRLTRTDQIGQPNVAIKTLTGQ